MEKEVEVEPYGIIQVCEVCRIGEMLPTGNNSYMPDIKVEHKCSECGHLVFFKEVFPSIRFRIKRR